MRSQMKATRITSPEIHSAKKMLHMNVLPEKQKPQIHRKQVDKIDKVRKEVEQE